MQNFTWLNDSPAHQAQFVSCFFCALHEMLRRGPWPGNITPQDGPWHTGRRGHLISQGFIGLCRRCHEWCIELHLTKTVTPLSSPEFTHLISSFMAPMSWGTHKSKNAELGNYVLRVEIEFSLRLKSQSYLLWHRSSSSTRECTQRWCWFLAGCVTTEEALGKDKTWQQCKWAAPEGLVNHSWVQREPNGSLS